jgi:uroporphyrinogen decarboxylase
MGLFNDRLKQENGKSTIPVWFMRQAGRYHDHYQNIKKNSDFMTMCKNPELACEITMGPILEFGFDGAILFSDLLFPLEQLGMGLSYEAGPPQLGYKLESLNDLKKLHLLNSAEEFYSFQNKALINLKNRLPKNKTLLGFVGAPFTLYTYAVEGSHSGNLISSKKGLYDGRFEGFMDILMPQLEQNLLIQAEGGADALCLFDTAVGELDLPHFKTFVLPHLRKISKKFKFHFPDKKLVYYSKHTNLYYLREIQDDNIDVLGIDWRLNLAGTLNLLGKDYYIQGNLDPSLLHLPFEILKDKWLDLWNSVRENEFLEKWICGLGHGVLPLTPQENVKKSVNLIQTNFIY